MIRPATGGDVEAVRRLSARVFARYGDYDEMLPGLVGQSGISTGVYVDAGCTVGFVMVGLAVPDPDVGRPAADLLAIAVEPEWEGRGVGAQLMRHALDLATALGGRHGVSEMRLSVADTNTRARRFFGRWGFTAVRGAGGRYPQGQVAIHMSRPLVSLGRDPLGGPSTGG